MVDNDVSEIHKKLEQRLGQGRMSRSVHDIYAFLESSWSWVFEPHNTIIGCSCHAFVYQRTLLRPLRLSDPSAWCSTFKHELDLGLRKSHLGSIDDCGVRGTTEGESNHFHTSPR